MKAITPGCFIVIQGKLGPGGNILEAGIVLQPPKLTAVSTPAEAEVAA